MEISAEKSCLPKANRATNNYRGFKVVFLLAKAAGSADGWPDSVTGTSGKRCLLTGGRKPAVETEKFKCIKVSAVSCQTRRAAPFQLSTVTLPPWSPSVGRV